MMSITYPEAKPARTAKSAAAPAAAEGSALFPGGAANLYDRARNARAASPGKGVSAAWIAAPVAVVLVGGAIALSLPHHAAAPTKASRTVTATTNSAAIAPLASVAAKPAPVKVEAAPIATKTVARTEATRTNVNQTPAHRAPSVASRVVTHSTAIEALPTAPQPYAQTQDGQAQASQSVQPTAITPKNTPAQTGSTPGNFAFTAPATGQSGAAPANAAPEAPVAIAPSTPPTVQPAPATAQTPPQA